MTGSEARDLAGADYVLAVPASETPKIQELHIVCGHIVCALVEQGLFGAQL
jgi:D-sedoheptulose 7-phosphate isomerase